MQPQEFSRVIFPETRFDFDSLKAIGLFCGAGLAGSFLLAAYGLDLNPGFLQRNGRRSTLGTPQARARSLRSNRDADEEFGLFHSFA